VQKITAPYPAKEHLLMRFNDGTDSVLVLLITDEAIAALLVQLHLCYRPKHCETTQNFLIIKFIQKFS
jgi:hypothetical protein